MGGVYFLYFPSPTVCVQHLFDLMALKKEGKEMTPYLKLLPVLPAD